MTTAGEMGLDNDKDKKGKAKLPNNKPDNFLDVEDDEARLTRIQTLLEHMNSSSPTSAFKDYTNNIPQASTISIPTFTQESSTSARTPFPVPQSDVLARAKAFLPLLKTSNAELLQQDAESVDIEQVGKDETYIEMNLGLGVFDMRDRRTVENEAPATASSSSDDNESSTSSSSPTSSLNSDSDSHSNSESSDSHSSNGGTSPT